jgi:hypothetical protein
MVDQHYSGHDPETGCALMMGAAASLVAILSLLLILLWVVTVNG